LEVLADVGPGIRPVAFLLGLDFIPLCWVRYAFLIPKDGFFDQSAQQFLGLLHEEKFQEMADSLPGYAAAILDDVQRQTGCRILLALLEFNKMPLLLGGEHTVTLGALEVLMTASEPVGIVQFDAHADLRDTYHNNRLSHAPDH
jgi:hypothetical protein